MYFEQLNVDLHLSSKLGFLTSHPSKPIITGDVWNKDIKLRDLTVIIIKRGDGIESCGAVVTIVVTPLWRLIPTLRLSILLNPIFVCF